MRALFLFGVLIAGSSIAESLPLPGVPPIDSKDEALYVASQNYFLLSSCYSFDFETSVEDLGEYWRITRIDTNSSAITPCRTMVISICKATGEHFLDIQKVVCAT